MILLLLIFAAGSDAHSQGCPDSMLHYWKLDETSGPTYVDYFDTLDASCPSSCPTAVTGIVNGAQRFNGGNEVDIPASSTFDWAADQDFTIEFWIRKSSTCAGSTNDYNNIIVGRYDGSGGNNLNLWWIGVNCNSSQGTQGAIRFVLRDDTGGDQVVTDGSVIDGDWHHIAAVRDNSLGQIIVYIDGQLDKAVTVPAYTYGFASSSAVTVGYLDFGGGYYLDGDVDELAVYNRALESTEIQMHYNDGINLGSGYCSTVTPPQIVTSPVTSIREDRLYAYDVDATGTPTPTYSLTTYPAGMTIDPATGLIEWTPIGTGSYSVEVEATNSGGSDQQPFTLEVTDVPVCLDAITHYWKFDEVSPGIYMDYWDTTTAACSNDCPTPTTGKVGNAQYFDGVDDEVLVGDDDTFDWGPGASFSIEFWMRKTSGCTGTTSSYNNVIIGRKGEGAGNLNIWWIGVNCDQAYGQGGIRYVLRDGGSTGSQIVGGTDVTDGAWHHVVAVRDGVQGINLLYVDGELDGSQPYTYTAGFDDVVPINIGHLPFSTFFRYDGDLDELAIYDRALTEDEIEYHYLYGDSGLNYCEDGFDPTYSVLTAEPSTPVSNAPSIDVEFSDDRGIDRGYYAVDNCNDAWAEIWSYDSGVTDTSASVSIPTPSEGIHSVYFKVRDDFGKSNEDSCSSYWTFTYDISVPDAPVVTMPQSGLTWNSVPDLEVSLSDNFGLFSAAYQVDGCDNWTDLWVGDCAQTDTGVVLSLPTPPEGLHSVYFRVSDDAGNARSDSCQPVWDFVYDITPPDNAVVESPSSGSHLKILPTLNISISDNLGIDKAYYQLDGCDGAWTEVWSYNADATDTTISLQIPGGISQGLHEVYLKVSDDAGNESTGICDVAYWFIYDTVPPASPSGFTVTPKNGACLLSWQNPTGDDSFKGVEIRRNSWGDGAYPEFDDFIPNPPGFPTTHTDGWFVYRANGQYHFDDLSSQDRNAFFYSIFAFDSAGNYSPLSVGDTILAASYLVGDLDYSGVVDAGDTLVLSVAYRTLDGDASYNAEADIGPVIGEIDTGVPQTDNQVDIEDLAVLCINFGLDGAYDGGEPPFMSGSEEETGTETAAADRAALVTLDPSFIDANPTQICTVWVNLSEEFDPVEAGAFKITYDETMLLPQKVFLHEDYANNTMLLGSIFPSDSILVDFGVLNGEFTGPGAIIGLQIYVHDAVGEAHLRFTRSVVKDDQAVGYSHGTIGSDILIETICGDVNGSNSIDIDDVVYTIAYVFQGGPAPDPVESGDVNCSGGVDIDDIVYLITYVFQGGDAPCDPDGDSIPDC